MLWGGRFQDKLNDEALKFSSSIRFDINLISEDILVSKVHAKMLHKIGLISESEKTEIITGLSQISVNFLEGNWTPSQEEYEDIHSAVEAELTNLIGTAAAKLHTGRSRNDQVATGMRLWVKKVFKNTIDEIVNLQKTLVETASENIDTIIPGYTHLQRAQPVSLAHHFLAYVEMLERDKKRIQFVIEETDSSPLGCGALAGSTLQLDSYFTSDNLGFSAPCNNSLDAVSDRDFLLDFLNSVSIGMMHLSRLSEELILWSSEEWKFVKLADKFTTGSSLMPQKKNPDLAELIRGKTGRVFGNQFGLLSTLKALPLSYNRDMQEDKEPIFDSFDVYYSSLKLTSQIISSMNINTDRFEEELGNGFILATDLADWLVLKGIPFREAHSVVGELVQYCEKKNITFKDVQLDDLKSVNEIFEKDALECFDIKTSLQRKKTFGSPNPDLVAKQIENWKAKLSNSLMA